MQEAPGFTHFLTQADALGHVILVLLLAMSVATWYLIVGKAWSNRKMRRAADGFQRMFWDAPDMKVVGDFIRQHGVNDPFSHLTHHGLRAVEQYRDKRGGRMIESGSADEFLTRALRRAIEQDTARMEYGLTVLGSVASAAPFVGLFGTVWGIYHALLAIGISGAGTLDKVAGPVGEALIMTALGLAVAIPAVLAFNAFARYNRVMLAEVDGFAHDLFAFMSTGNRNNEAASPTGAQRTVRAVAGAV
ncbi:MAG TPA: MotA/TolQ/ExbB proton channel family protein [Steroidobacteraceae bacterium]|nr:MotA/TolQ/ExbB proton channel family protein [Steroidobacteraceae bacterium]